MNIENNPGDESNEDKLIEKDNLQGSKDDIDANIEAIVEEGKGNKEKTHEKKPKEPKQKAPVIRPKPNKAKYQGSTIKKKFAPKKIGTIDSVPRPSPIASSYEIVAQIESDEEK